MLGKPRYVISFVMTWLGALGVWQRTKCRRMRLLVLCGVLEEGQSLNGSEGLVCAVGGNKKNLEEINPLSFHHIQMNLSQSILELLPYMQSL